LLIPVFSHSPPISFLAVSLFPLALQHSESRFNSFFSGQFFFKKNLNPLELVAKTRTNFGQERRFQRLKTQNFSAIAFLILKKNISIDLNNIAREKVLKLLLNTNDLQHINYVP